MNIKLKVSITLSLAAIDSVGGYCFPCYSFLQPNSRKGRRRGTNGHRYGSRIRLGNAADVFLMAANTTNTIEIPSVSVGKLSRRQTLSMMLGSVSSSIPFTGADFDCTRGYAMQPQEASSAYDRYAPSYDILDGGPMASFLDINKARKQLLSHARGRVLEIGVGTGLNIDKYSWEERGVGNGGDEISSIGFVDISAGMLQQAKDRAASYFQGLQSESKGRSSVDVKFFQADATSYEQMTTLFNRHSFDTIVDTFTLCVLGNEGALNLLSLMKELLADKGQILLLENSIADNPLLGWYQDLTAEAIASSWGGGKGCLYNQNVSSLVREAGLSIVEEKSYMGGLFRSFICITG